jgi:hypothetical protein
VSEGNHFGGGSLHAGLLEQVDCCRTAGKEREMPRKHRDVAMFIDGMLSEPVTELAEGNRGAHGSPS